MSQEPPEQVFTAGDLVQIRGRGIEIKEAIRQITLLRNPPGYLSLDRPCTVDDGITSIPPDGMQGLTALHGSAAREARVLRFVPASGAASRMFRDLLYYQRQGRELWPDDVKAELRLGRREAGALRAFLKKIRRFAFAADLERVLAASGASLDEHAASGPFKPILDALLSRDAMGYGDLPKGLLKFHAYADEIRTPLEEHLVEAAEDSRDARGICRLHLTVSAEHLDRFRRFVDEVKQRYETRFDVRYKVTFSVQKPSTDTLALDMQGTPARTEDGRLLFRPGGHGALLENLQDLEADLLIVKNIDNVAQDRLKPATSTWSRLLIGHLLKVQQEVFAHARRLEDEADENAAGATIDFLKQTFHRDAASQGNRKALLEFVSRPIRVCGMVPNTGEPGGGPFWVRGADGSLSLQIVERAQVDPDSEQQQGILVKGTHFNPVFMAFGLRDHQGKPFDLKRYVDPATAVVATKSSAARDLRVLERPGLWNGAMAHWNTIFVEQPIEVFNPVKTVVDLLRKEHQPR